MHSLLLDLLSLLQAELDDQIGFHFNFLESYEIKLRGMKQWVEGRVFPEEGLGLDYEAIPDDVNSDERAFRPEHLPRQAMP